MFYCFYTHQINIVSEVYNYFYSYHIKTVSEVYHFFITVFPKMCEQLFEIPSIYLGNWVSNNQFPLNNVRSMLLTLNAHVLEGSSK